MAGKISDMTASTTVAMADQVEVLQGGANLRATLAQIKNLFGEVSYIANNWYSPFRSGTSLGAGNAFAGSVHFLPFVVTRTITISTLAMFVTTVGAAGHTAQAAIYANDATLNLPTGAPLCSTGSIATDVTVSTFVQGSVTPVQLTPGIYWMGVNMSNNTAIFATSAAGAIVAQSLVGSATLADLALTAGSHFLRVGYTQTYGTWPTLSGATGLSFSKDGQSACVYFKVSSVP